MGISAEDIGRVQQKLDMAANYLEGTHGTNRDIRREAVAVMREAAALLRQPPAAPEGAWQGIMVDRDADLRREMRAYLDTLTIHGDNIGEIRRSLFVPWDSQWNGWVRDETAIRECKLPAPPDRQEGPHE